MEKGEKARILPDAETNSVSTMTYVHAGAEIQQGGETKGTAATMTVRGTSTVNRRPPRLTPSPPKNMLEVDPHLCLFVVLVSYPFLACLHQLEVQKLQAELAEYEEEFSKLKNQVCGSPP